VDVGGDEIGDVGVNEDFRVEGGDFAAGGFGFGQGLAGVGLIKEDLALQVALFDEVAVNDGEAADAGAGEQGGGGGSGGSAAGYGDVRLGEQKLAVGTDSGEDNLALIAFG
jgi:hypothetical protein